MLRLLLEIFVMVMWSMIFAFVIALARPASALPDDLVVVLLLDDVGSGYISSYRDASLTGPMPDYMPDIETAGDFETPNIDAIGTEGFTHTGFHVHAVCSVTRSILLGWGNPWLSGYGRNKAAADTIGDLEVDKRSKHLFYELDRAGYDIGYFGKWHVSRWPDATLEPSATMPPAEMGIEYGEFFPSNLVNTIPGYDESTETGWSGCGRTNNFFVMQTLAGAVRFHGGPSESVYTSDYVFDEARDLIQETSGGKLAIFIAPPHPHSPWVIPSDPLGCTAGSPEKSDLPPGSTAGNSTELYRDALERVDQQFGLLMTDIAADAGLDASTFVFVVGDNGEPDTGLSASDGMSVSCADSPGLKKSPYRCGRRVPFLARGPNITAGQVLDRTQARIFNAGVDFPATVLDLLGSEEGNGYGISFADCMTDSNGQSAESCAHNRASLAFFEFEPLGGSAGTRQLMPDPATDNNTVFTQMESSVIHKSDNADMLLHRVYDTTSFPDDQAFEAVLWGVDDDGEQGRYVDDASDDLAVSIDGALVDGDFYSGPSADESANLATVQRITDDIIERKGQPTASVVGGSF